jgi:hypothetical protein
MSSSRLAMRSFAVRPLVLERLHQPALFTSSRSSSRDGHPAVRERGVLADERRQLGSAFAAAPRMPSTSPPARPRRAATRPTRRVLRQPRHRRVADPAPGDVDDAQECLVRRRVGDEAQVGQRVPHLAPLVEARAADDAVRMPRGAALPPWRATARWCGRAHEVAQPSVRVVRHAARGPRPRSTRSRRSRPPPPAG